MSKISVWIDQREGSDVRGSSKQVIRAITVAAVLISLSAFLVIIFSGNWATPLVYAMTTLVLISALGIRVGLNRSQVQNKIKISSACKVNAHAAKALKHLPNRYANLLTDINPTTKEAKRKSAAMLRSIMESYLALGAFEKTGEKRRRLNGALQEHALMIEAYAGVSDGRGYVLIEPFGREVSIVHNAGLAPVTRALREVNLVDWEVEPISYDDDIALFLLYDPLISRALDLSRAPDSMFKTAQMIAYSKGKWSIPLQPNLDWDISKSPHAIISGTTGSGKSYFTNYLIAMSAIKGCYLILADPKRSDLSAMADYMPEHRVAHNPEDILELARSAVDIMAKRYELMDTLRKKRKELFQADFSQYGFCPILFVVEELASLLPAFDKAQRSEFESLIKTVTLQGRQAGVGLVSVMQQPNANNIPTECRSQTGLRIMLGDATQSEYKMLFGDGLSLTGSVQGIGRGYCSVLGETCGPIRFEAPRLDQKQIADMMARALSAQGRINPLACTLNRREAEGERACLNDWGASDYDICAPVPSATRMGRRD